MTEKKDKTDLRDQQVENLLERSAKKPRPLVIGDVIDVFGEGGQFIARGKVKEIHAKSVYVDFFDPLISNEELHGDTRKFELIEGISARKADVRHANALKSEKTLAEWEEAKGLKPGESVAPE